MNEIKITRIEMTADELLKKLGLEDKKIHFVSGSDVRFCIEVTDR